MGVDQIGGRERTTSGAPMPGKQRVRVTVVVADDHPLYRDGVVRALLASGQVEIVAEAPDGRVALAAIQEHQPDVALLDYKLPGLDGVAVTHAVDPGAAADARPDRLGVHRQRHRLQGDRDRCGGIHLEGGEPGAHRRRGTGLRARGERRPARDRRRARLRDPPPQAERRAGADSARAGDPPSDRGRQEPAADRDRSSIWA